MSVNYLEDAIRSISSTESILSRGRPSDSPLRTSSSSMLRNCCQFTMVGDERAGILNAGSTFRRMISDPEAGPSDSKSSMIL